MVDVVLDLETFGVAPGSAVVSIGAVCVDSGDEFYTVIDKPSGAVDAESVRWWLEQAEDVRGAVKSGQPEVLVLSMFSVWLNRQRGDGELRLWGSEDFDTVILGEAYARNGMERPWRYREPRGMRTVLGLSGVDEDAMPWGGTEHIAIECARHAAAALTLALWRLDGALVQEGR